MNAERLLIVWRTIEFGYLINPEIDMYYLSGKLELNQDLATIEFEMLAKGLNARAVMESPELGTRIQLYDNIDRTNIMHALVLNLFEGEILIRRYYEPKAVAWLLEQVK